MNIKISKHFFSSSVKAGVSWLSRLYFAMCVYILPKVTIVGFLAKENMRKVSSWWVGVVVSEVG